MTTRRRLKPVGDLFAPAVAETVQALPGDAVDAAAVRLAEQYAAAIDAAGKPCEECGALGHTRVLAELGPKLLAALVELGATPKARSAAKVGGGEFDGGSLAKLRAARG